MPPELLQGGLAVDDRGEVAFVNEFAFADVKRFYTVSNHAVGFVRAWHAHRNEAKYVLAVSGALLVGCVEIDDWERPSRDLEVHRFVLSERDPAVLHMLSAAITACKERGKYVGICGQGPSDHPDLALWLVEQGIESMSLNPDTVIDTWLHLAKAATSNP